MDLIGIVGLAALFVLPLLYLEARYERRELPENECEAEQPSDDWRWPVRATGPTAESQLDTHPEQPRRAA